MNALGHLFINCLLVTDHARGLFIHCILFSFIERSDALQPQSNLRVNLSIGVYTCYILCKVNSNVVTLRIYAQYMGLPSNGHRNNHRLETYKIILIVEPEQKVASIQKGIDSITPKRNRFFGLSPPQIKFIKIRVTGAKKGCASSMKKSKSEVLHNPIQKVHNPSDSKQNEINVIKKVNTIGKLKPELRFFSQFLINLMLAVMMYNM